MELHLADNAIGPDGATALADGLAHLNNLQRLNLDGNRIGDAGARALSALINAGNSQLVSLELFKNGIGNAGADAIAEAFTFSSTLAHLDLQQNSIGEPGAGAIAEALKANQSVQVLRLNKNQVDMEGIEKIANALKSNSTLLYLDVSHNPLGRFGCKYICDALHGHMSLKEVHLSGVGLTDEHMEMLKQSIMFNSVLLVLNLSMNSIENGGVAHLMDALRINSIVQEIEIWGNKVDDSKKSALYLKCKDRLAA
jgi:Ran GTPase-activating protein (RanGAP) involved in mRNA processing and transport